jgi:hypothetical protein
MPRREFSTAQAGTGTCQEAMLHRPGQRDSVVAGLHRSVRPGARRLDSDSAATEMNHERAAIVIQRSFRRFIVSSGFQSACSNIMSFFNVNKAL